VSIFTNLKSYFARRRMSLTDKADWQSVGLTSYSGEHVSQFTAMALSTVWACVNLVSGTIGSTPLEIRRRHALGHYAVDAKHPLYRILHDSPNADQSALDFWELMAASLELQGDGIARKIMDGSQIIALQPANSTDVQRRRQSNGRIRYQWSEDGESFDLDEDQVFHIRGFGGTALGGMSTLRYARNAFGLAQAIDRSASSVFENGMQPGGALSFKEFLTPENRQIAETKLAEKFIGARNAGRPMILEGDAQFKQFSINPEDAQMLEARRFSVEEICRFFGVPPHMVGHTEKNSSWGKGLEQQNLAFVTYTLRRRLKRIEQAIDKQLLSSSDRARGVSAKFNLEALLRGDSTGRAQFYREMTQIGAMTINEVRAKEGLPPVEGGSVPRMQMQNVPITEAGNDV
jgi:HK97 family phage portal protein